MNNLEKLFHMKGGLGDTSYPKNSSLQWYMIEKWTIGFYPVKYYRGSYNQQIFKKMAADKVKHITLETIEKVIVETRPKSVGIADMGCSSGPNTLSNVKEFVGAVEEACRKIEQPEPELRFYLNDLPGNDFNTVFQALPDFYDELKSGKDRAGRPAAVYIAGFPGTFYGRVFPNKSLHLVYSSNSLHWLSRVPLGIYDERNESINKESIYITRMSSREVKEAYLKQFQEDFSLFLESRSQEVINGGKMVLILLGRNGDSHVDKGVSLLWEILYQSLATLVDQGEVEEGKLECYEVNFYAASKEELEEEVRKEGSFKIDVIEKYEGGELRCGKALGKAVRSIQEPMIARHFGLGERILDKLFDLFGRLVDQELAKDHDHIITTTSIVLVLTKL